MLSLSTYFLYFFYIFVLTNYFVSDILISTIKWKGCIGIETHERVKFIRKFFKLSQEEFGKKLGVTRDVIGNIELNRLAKPEQKLSLLKLICSQFSINEDWLINGIGEMLNETKESYIESLVQQYNLDDMDRKILQTYIDLPDAHRTIIKNYIKSITSVLTNDNDVDVEKELEIYRNELEIEKKAKAKSSVSIYTSEEKNA